VYDAEARWFSFLRRLFRLPGLRLVKPCLRPLLPAARRLSTLSLIAWPLLTSPTRRRLYGEMVAFQKRLPHLMALPVREAMTVLSEMEQSEFSPSQSELEVRRLADTVAATGSADDLGLCLRRSLLRFHFLAPHRLPLRLHFGARLNHLDADHPLAGHAWLTLAGIPYYEEESNWRGFEIFYSYPDDTIAG